MATLRKEVQADARRETAPQLSATEIAVRKKTTELFASRQEALEQGLLNRCDIDLAYFFDELCRCAVLSAQYLGKDRNDIKKTIDGYYRELVSRLYRTSLTKPIFQKDIAEVAGSYIKFVAQVGNAAEAVQRSRNFPNPSFSDIRIDHPSITNAFLLEQRFSTAAVLVGVGEEEKRSAEQLVSVHENADHVAFGAEYYEARLRSIEASDVAGFQKFIDEIGRLDSSPSDLDTKDSWLHKVRSAAELGLRKAYFLSGVESKSPANFEAQNAIDAKMKAKTTIHEIGCLIYIGDIESARELALNFAHRVHRYAVYDDRKVSKTFPEKFFSQRERIELMIKLVQELSKSPELKDVIEICVNSPHAPEWGLARSSKRTQLTPELRASLIPIAFRTDVIDALSHLEETKQVSRTLYISTVTKLADTIVDARGIKEWREIHFLMNHALRDDEYIKFLETLKKGKHNSTVLNRAREYFDFIERKIDDMHGETAKKAAILQEWEVFCTVLAEIKDEGVLFDVLTEAAKYFKTKRGR